MGNAPRTASVATAREGGKYEAAGFVMILVGMGTGFASLGIGAAIGAVGFVVFLIGRFK